MKTINSYFKNGFSYAAGIEDWCRKSYPHELKFTFCQDFAIADWFGLSAVKDTYKRVKQNWLSDYKAWTEVEVALNLLAWAHNQLKQQGLDDQDEFIKLYSDLYEEASNAFYKKYKDNEEAIHYHFEMTD